MAKEKKPGHFSSIKKKHVKFINAAERLGKVIKEEGPIDEKTAHLIQLAAAASIRSEGSVHSHVRRAIDAGATNEEIEHALILLTSTIGFPTVAAALSWAKDDMLEKE